MDCFHDFCLACDRESTAGPYCSQTCRLADLNKATTTNGPPSPTTPMTPSSKQTTVQSSWTASTDPYVLPQWGSTNLSQPSSHSNRPQSSSYFTTTMTTTTTTTAADAPQRSLSPSTSRSSLSSNASASSSSSAAHAGITEQAKLELQEYFSSFDKTRASRRRQSTW